MDHQLKAKTPPKKKVASDTFSFYEALEKILQGFSVRSQDIVRERFGVSSKQPKTLEEIGKEYRITRERVRQIIRSVMKEVLSKKADAPFQTTKSTLELFLGEKSAVAKESDILESLGKGDSHEEGALRFFLECIPGIVLVKEDIDVERSYALPSFSLDAWHFLKNKVCDLFKKEQRVFEREELEKFFSEVSKSENPETLFHFLALSKEVQQNVFGKWGLASWSDVHPKGTREKAYLILKTLKKPLHFREITELIDSYGLQKRTKKTHPQTVHNELIKDKRFVLVGRGTYALSEWGYQRGTVRQVLEAILSKSSQPMTRDEIIRSVLEMRQVKKSTIVINLNTFFARVGKDAYTNKKASSK